MSTRPRLLVFSDGIFEIEKPDGAMWPFADFLERIRPELPRDGDLIERHLRYVRGLRGGTASSATTSR